MAGLFSFFKKKNKDDAKKAQDNHLNSVDTQNTINTQEQNTNTTESKLEAESIVTDKDETKAQEATVQAITDTNHQEMSQALDIAYTDKVELEENKELLNAEAENDVSQEDVAKEKVNEQEQTIDNVTASVEVREKKKSSFFERLRKTRENIAFGLSALIKGRKIDEDLYEELETSLLTADLGVDTTNKIIERLRQEAKLKELHDASLLKNKLNEILIDILKPCQIPLDVTQNSPFVILMVGVNGAGKTTTIGKLAQKYKEQGLKVMLAAGDTFRAAAVEQLKEWGQRVDVPVIAQATGSDSASVLFDALNSAKAKNIDVLICDTAGRLQNKDNLMDELSKIVRVMKKIDENVPHEVMLVLDGTTGQNAMSQATIFSKAVNVSGLCLTKLDGSAKGGVIFALADKFQLPIRYVGIGEKASDLREFSTEDFVKALTDID